MSKVTVTKAQMEVVNITKGEMSLEKVLVISFDKNDRFINKYKILNSMTAEQIVLAWNGRAEVEPEFISFDEAYKARKEGKRVLLLVGNRRVLFMTNVKLEGCFLGSLTMDELFNGKFIVEGANNA